MFRITYPLPSLERMALLIKGEPTNRRLPIWYVYIYSNSTYPFTSLNTSLQLNKGKNLTEFKSIFNFNDYISN